jgi:hypothetical protein
MDDRFSAPAERPSGLEVNPVPNRPSPSPRLANREELHHTHPQDRELSHRSTARRFARRTRSAVKRRSRRILREARLLAEQQKWHRHYGQVQQYCQFIGFPRSGHTLVGALLNAHSDAVIGFEANALRQIRKSDDRTALFDRIMRADRRFESLGWRWSGYDYEVQGQWQGRYRRLAVIGDKRGGGSSREIARDPSLLDRLRGTVQVPLRGLVVVRNPFDNVARISTRSKITLAEATSRYLEVLHGTETAIDRIGPDDVHVVRLEDFVDDPNGGLVRIARFLALDIPDGWLESCTKLVFDSPRRARDDVTWTSTDRAIIDSEITRSFLLTGYQF